MNRPCVLCSSMVACGAAEQDAADTGDGTSATTTGDTTNVESGESTGADPSSTSTTAVDGSSTSSDDTGTTGEPIELHGACPLADRVGGFALAMEPDYTAFSGAVSDGVVPVTVLEQVGEVGDCILMRRNNPFCDPMCESGTTCDFDGTCIPYPVNHDVGVVTVTGLLQPVVLEPLPPTFNYFDTSLQHPAFDVGAAIELTAEGGDYSAFALAGAGITMIEPVSAELSMTVDQPLAIEWTTEQVVPSIATVRIVLSVDQHGATPVQLVCEAASSGSIEIAGELITAFLDFGVSGFPNANYYLETVDSVQLEPGCVELAVRSHRQTPLTVDGHTPCDSPDDCPEGQTCDLKIQTCL